MIAIIFGLLLFNAVATSNFLTTQTMIVNLTQVSTIGIVALGMTLVIATGGIDLSVGALMAIAGALAAKILLGDIFDIEDPALRLFVSYALPLLVVGTLGVLNGLLIAGFGIQPIIATLILFIAGRGFAQVLTNGQLQIFKNESFQFIGLGKIFGMPFQVLLMLGFGLLLALALRYTLLGPWLLAIGGNARAARLSGIPTSAVIIGVYGLSGIFAGVAGFIVISINGSSDANLVGLNMELDAIAAALVGGTLLTGGKARLLGTLLGAVLLQLIRYTLLAQGVPDAAAMVIKAAIILAAVLIQQRTLGGLIR
jgi:ribose transport system permease protein